MITTRRARDYEQYYDITEIGGDLDGDRYLKELAEVYGVGTKCFRCGSPLLQTDVKGYHSVCLKCDENFYSFEEVK